MCVLLAVSVETLYRNDSAIMCVHRHIHVCCFSACCPLKIIVSIVGLEYSMCPNLTVAICRHYLIHTTIFTSLYVI